MKKSNHLAKNSNWPLQILLFVVYLSFSNLAFSQRFVATVGTNTGNSFTTGWQAQTSSGSWSNTIGSGLIPNWQPWSTNTNNLSRGANLSNTNFVWGGTGQMTHYKIEFERKISDCRRVFIQVGGDDEFSVRLNGGWLATSQNGSGGQIYFREITDNLKCGMNELYVAVNNTNGIYHYFIGIIDFGPETNTLTNDRITHTEIKCGKNVTLTAPTISGLTDVAFEWYNPQGQKVGTNQNLTLIYPSTNNNGKYKVKISKACCVYEKEIDLIFPDCYKCDVALNIVRTMCKKAELSFQSDYVNIECYQWQLNGQNIKSGTGSITPVALKNGKNKICLFYWGKMKSDPNKICCGERCEEIDVPIPISETRTVEFCRLAGDGYSFDPCSEKPAFTKNFSWGIVVDGQYQTILTQDCDISTPLILSEGTHYFSYYDANGCLLKTLILTVVEKPLVTTYCHKIVMEPCDQPIDPQNIMPDPSDLGCEECYNVSLLDPNAIALPLPVAIVTESRFYYKIFNDKINCRQCYFLIEIKKQKCAVDANFTITQGSGTYELIFTNISTGIGTPINATWQVTNLSNGQTILNKTRSFGHPEYSILQHNLLSPGNYKICLNVTYYYCGNECFKKICFRIRVKIDGGFDILEQTESAPPPQENPAAESKNPNNWFETINENSNAVPNKKKTSSAHEFKIQPNPTSGVFELKVNASAAKAKYSLEVVDVNGKSIMQKNDFSGNQKVDMSENAAGLYYLKIKMGDKLETHKLIKY